MRDQVSISKDQDSQPVQANRLYSVREAASLLGFCEITIHRHIRSGRLNASRPGGFHYRILGSDLISLLNPSANMGDREKAVDEC